MHIQISSAPTIPFSAARAVVRELRKARRLDDDVAVYLRPVTHSLPEGEFSLSDSQTPGDQLRFYTRPRVLRGWRYVGRALATDAEPLSIDCRGIMGPQDREFLDALRAGGLVVDIVETPASHEHRGEDARFARVLGAVADDDAETVADELDRLLATGDSWTALSIATAYDNAHEVSTARLATSMGLAFGLQSENEQSERMFRLWERSGGIEAARAQYSLAMLYARHHDPARLKMSRAREYLEAAYETLHELPESRAVRYERIFNRNGFALLLFREGSFAEAAALLEAGVEELSSSSWSGQIHHTVLLNNLGRVYAAMGREVDAIASLRQAVEFDPRFAEYRQDLASQLADAGRVREAYEEALVARSLDPAVPEIHELTGYLAEQLGLLDDARASYATAWDLGHSSAGLSLARLLSDQERYGELTAVIDEIAGAQSKSDDRVEAEILRLEARSMLDGSVDVQDGLRRLLADYPDSALLAENLVMLEDSA